jgi:tRNA(Ile)-lysidine synthase
MKKQELINLVKEKLANHGAVNVPLILAVSGGPDSMTLLDVVRQVLFDVNIHVVHVNHGLRKTAGRDEKVVADYCQKYGLDFVARKADVAGVRARSKTSVEETARDLRYKILQKEAARYRAAYILLAHTSDDQAETVLFNIVRGAGLRGLGGMKEQNGNLLRPLLSVPKVELVAYAKSAKVAYVVDESNASLEYTRNFIRRKLVPLIAKINPQFSGQLLQTAQTVQGAEMAVRDMARLHIAALAKISKTELVFPLSKFMEMTPFMRAEVIKVGADMLGVGGIEWSAAQLAQLDKMIGSGNSMTSRSIGGKLLVEKRYDKISISLT